MIPYASISKYLCSKTHFKNCSEEEIARFLIAVDCINGLNSLHYIEFVSLIHVRNEEFVSYLKFAFVLV